MTLKCDGGCKKLCIEGYFQNRFVSLKICGGIILFLPDFRRRETVILCFCDNHKVKDFFEV